MNSKYISSICDCLFPSRKETRETAELLKEKIAIYNKKTSLLVTSAFSASGSHVSIEGVHVLYFRDGVLMDGQVNKISNVSLTEYLEPYIRSSKGSEVQEKDFVKIVKKYNLTKENINDIFNK